MTSAGVFMAGVRICEPGMTPSYRVLLSLAAGFIWPLLLVGAVEFTSLAVYSTAEHYAYVNGPELEVSPDGTEQTDGVIVPMR